jgi:hypothetical protein
VCISAPNLVDKASSTSMGGRIDGLAADGEEGQDHRVPLRKVSSIPSGTSCPSPAYSALSVFLFCSVVDDAPNICSSIHFHVSVLFLDEFSS